MSNLARSSLAQRVPPQLALRVDHGGTAGGSVVLRPYQCAALDELAVRWVELDRRGIVPHLLLVSRTGTGKTVIGGEFLRRVLAKGRRAAFVVRDRTLLDQTSRHLDRIGLVDHGVVAAGHRRNAPSLPLQVCSAQTLTARGEAPEADVLVFDEAHGSVCDTSRAIADAYPRATILGLTATPERGDGKPLGHNAGGIYHSLVQVRATYAELVSLGALAPFVLLGPTSGKPEKTLCEDPIVALTRDGREGGHPAGRIRKTVIFGADRAHARDLATGARAAGFRAAAVDGETKTSMEDIERFKLPTSHPRALDVLVNCDLLVEGWDAPCVEVLILARGCSSWSAYIQILGRALRPSPETGKTYALIRDLRGMCWIHGTPSDERIFALEGIASRPAEALPALRSCTACGCTYRSIDAKACPRCGRIPPPPPRPRVVAKAMGDVTGIPTASYTAKRAAFEALVKEQRAKGYKPKWVGVMFQQRFGHWPAFRVSSVKSESSTPNTGVSNA